MKLILPIAAMAVGMLPLVACGDEERMAENTYAVPSERDSPGYADRARGQTPDTLANPPATDTGRLNPPSELDDLPPAPSPGAPSPTLPPT